MILLGASIALVMSGTASATTTTDAVCTHGPTSRGCWTAGYSIDTDYDYNFPTTGNAVSYQFELTNGTCNPDAAGDKPCLLINGQYPGPLIRANWGDDVHVTVTNLMQDAGTSLHFHGLRQYHTNAMDGVNGVTECPLAPGDTKTYSFQATQ